MEITIPTGFTTNTHTAHGEKGFYGPTYTLVNVALAGVTVYQRWWHDDEDHRNEDVEYGGRTCAWAPDEEAAVQETVELFAARLAKVVANCADVE